MKLLLLILTLFTSGQHQDSIRVAGSGSMADIDNIAYSKGDEIIQYDFKPLSDETTLTIDLFDLSTGADLSSKKKLLSEVLMKSKNSKVNLSVGHNEKDVNLKLSLIGDYMSLVPIKAINDKKINVFIFRSMPGIMNKTVPVVLLVDNEKEIDTNLIGRILNSKDIESINKSDFEALKKISKIVKVVTYKLE